MIPPFAAVTLAAGGPFVPDRPAVPRGPPPHRPIASPKTAAGV